MCIAWCDALNKRKQNMKKLLILASAVAVACSLNAASYVWGFSNGETVAPDGQYFGEGSYADASAFLYLGSASVVDGKLDISGLTLITSTGAMNPAPDYNWGYFSTSTMPSSDLVSTSQGQEYTLILVGQDGVSSLSDGDTYQMIVANGTSSITAIPGAGETTYYANFANNTQYSAGAWAATTVGAVPEPTSGLLMLLGMAGLALRRRRA